MPGIVLSALYMITQTYLEEEELLLHMNESKLNLPMVTQLVNCRFEIEDQAV